MKEILRRKFIKQTAKIIATCLFNPSNLKAINQLESINYDVIIVGAGLSGLHAAKILCKNGKRVLILEADNKIGGRVCTIPLQDNQYLELGGQWIAKSHLKMHQLLNEYKLSTFPTYQKGDSLISFEDKLKKYRSIPSIPIRSIFALLNLTNKFERLVKSIIIEAPWKSPNSHILDSITVNNWIVSKSKNKLAIELFSEILQSLFCCELDNISMFQALIGVKSSGSLNFMIETKKGAQEDRIIGGAKQICDTMLKNSGANIQLNAPVTHIVQQKNGVEVTTTNQIYKANKIIISIPLPSVKQIIFEPKLPMERQILVDNMFMASVIKYQLVYDNPFWRTNNLNGQSLTLGGYVSGTFDNSLPESSNGILVAFVHANKAKDLFLKTKDERISIIKKEIKYLFGKEAEKPILINEHTYIENQWIKRAYSGIFPPNILSKYGEEIRKPFQNIHWAGTETSTYFMGYMEGAVLSGDRAANEILKL